MPFDVALRYDPATRRCDLAIERGDLAVDRTLATPMLVALFSDRRARPDDALPSGVTEFLVPSAANPRRGWVGDALDGQGRRLGSLLWLLSREKQTEQTRLRAAAYAGDVRARRFPAAAETYALGGGGKARRPRVAGGDERG